MTEKKRKEKKSTG